MTVWLVGEQNPYSRDPRTALHFIPANGSGNRLRRILGMRRWDYLRSFERRNLVQGERWSFRAARRGVQALMHEVEDSDVVVLLGQRVYTAWGLLDWRPFRNLEACTSNNPDDADAVAFFTIVTLPHPSGLSRVWNDPESKRRARDVLVSAAPHLIGVVGISDK